MKAKRIKLEIPPEESFYFALSSPNPIHQLAWAINSKLNIQLRECHSMERDSAMFPIVKDESLATLIVQNRAESTLLIKELPRVDYIMRIQGVSIDAITLAKELKHIPSITAVIPIDTARVKSVSTLLGSL